MTQPTDRKGRSKLETRVDRIEQILPKLATKDDLRAAVEPLATKMELRTTVEESEERTRRHVDVRFEALRDDIRLVAEGLADLSGKVDRNHAATKAEIASHDRRLTRVEANQAKR